MNVAQLEQDVRERINRPRTQRALMEKAANWNAVCSALDVIGDTEIALSAYLSHPKVDEDGLRYLVPSHQFGASFDPLILTQSGPL